MNYTLESFGEYTTSDNSLIILDKEKIAYSLEGNLMIADAVAKTTKKLFLDFSMIKVIIRYSDNEVLVGCENAKVFLYDYENDVLKNFGRVEGVNNLYLMGITNDKRFVFISTHVLCDEDYFINWENDAFSVVEVDYTNLKMNRLFSRKSKNDFSLNFEDTTFISVSKKDDTCIEVAKLTFEGKVEKSKTFEVKSDVSRIKRAKNLYLLQCFDRMIYLFDSVSFNIINKIKVEGKGGLGECCIVEERYLILSNKSAQLLKVDLQGITEKEPMDKVFSLSDDSRHTEVIIKNCEHISSLNWCIQALSFEMVAIANEKSLSCIKLNHSQVEKYEVRFNKKNILSMSGCGVAINNKTKEVIAGDLGGNLTVISFGREQKSVKTLPLSNDSCEMIRCISTDDEEMASFIGTMNGNVYVYSEDKVKPLFILNDFATITCVRYYAPYLIYSNINGFIFIAEKTEDSEYKLIYSFQAHFPDEKNTDIKFGSLHLKSEIWSFISYPRTALKKSKDMIYIATGSEDQTVRIWEISTKEKEHILVEKKKENALAVTCLDWGEKEVGKEFKEILISCSDDKTINIYSIKESFKNILRVDFAKYIFCFFTLTYISMSTQLPVIAIGTQVGYLILYNIHTNKINFLEKIHYGGIEGVAFDKNNQIATCSNDNVVNILSIKVQKEKEKV